MSKKPKAKDKFSRDELLGFEKCFSLNQSEYIARKIIDQLLFLTYQQIRLHNVLALEEEFSVYRAMKTLKQGVSFSLIEPEVEYEKSMNYTIDFGLMPNRIDTWASNRAQILRNVPEEEPPLQPPKKPVAPSKFEKDSKESASDSNPATKRDSTVLKKSKLLKKMENVIKKNTAPREFNIESKPLHIEALVQYDEMDQIKLNGYRAYFQEKEIEDKKNKILEKVQEEKAKEEEKKIKQFTQIMNASSLLSWDSQGQFLPIKQQNTQDIKDFLLIAPQIKDKKVIYDADKVFAYGQSQIIKTPGEEVIRDSLPSPEVRERFYQPDPLVKIDLAKGTTMEYYGKKKRAGNFDKGDGRLSHVDYMELLSQIHPYHFAAIHMQNKPQSAKNESEGGAIEEEGESPDSKHQIPSFTRLYHMFRDVDDDKLQNVPSQMKKEQEELLKNLSPRTTRELLRQIKKRQKETKIKRDREFRLTDIDDVANEKIYEPLKNQNEAPEQLLQFQPKQKFKPPHFPDDNKKSLGSTITKLPRERRKTNPKSKTAYDQSWIKERLIKKDKEQKLKNEEKERKRKEEEANKLPSLKKSIINSFNDK